jgi:hypothetical protein
VNAGFHVGLQPGAGLIVDDAVDHRLDFFFGKPGDADIDALVHDLGFSSFFDGSAMLRTPFSAGAGFQRIPAAG